MAYDNSRCNSKGIQTKYGSVPSHALDIYQSRLIDKVFKILGMKDDGCTTLDKYIDGLLFELIGAKSLVACLCNNGDFISLLAILENLSGDNHSKAIVKQQVFKAIKIIKRLEFDLSNAKSDA